MDFFGIGQAVKGALLVYFRASRGTGRTTSLVDSVKNGDRICFINSIEARRVERLCKERDVEVKCVVIDPRDPGSIYTMGSLQDDGRNIFDHSWVEQYYLDVIERAQRDLADLEKQTSGYGAKHRETKRRAMEMARWRTP